MCADDLLDVISLPIRGMLEERLDDLADATYQVADLIHCRLCFLVVIA
jgi:hypothetical protein